jgi:pilus assembly protein CpaB
VKSGSFSNILISLMVAAVVVYFGNALIQPDPPLPLVPVVVAATDISTGSLLKKNDLKVIQILEKSRPEGTFGTIDDLTGKVAKQPLYEGEILLERRVLSDLSGSLLAAMLEPGMRAITLRVDDVSGVAGFLLPGSWVDVIKTSGGQARTLLQRLKILAVGQQLDSEGKKAVTTRAVTLEVTPEQAEVLTGAGSVRLVLRNPNDSVAEPPMTVNTEPPPAPEPIIAPPPVAPTTPLVSVEVIKRTTVSRQSFADFSE